MFVCSCVLTLSFSVSLQDCSLETQYMIKRCQEAAGLPRDIGSVQETKPITHLVRDVYICILSCISLYQH